MFRGFVLSVAASMLCLNLLTASVQADESIPRVSKMTEAAIQLANEQDTFAAIELLAGQSDAVAATKDFGQVMHHFYWKAKDLSRAIAFGRAGLQYGLTAAPPLQATQPKQAREIRSAAKSLAYDLASFTWTGWDEPGISITESDLKLGLDAARVNLRLAIELDKDALRLSRAHWILGAQQLAAKLYPEAIQSFQKAAEFAKTANNTAEELLGLGFAALAKVMQTKGADGQAELDMIKLKLKPLQDGEFFVGQLDTALKVFNRR